MSNLQLQRKSHQKEKCDFNNSNLEERRGAPSHQDNNLLPLLGFFGDFFPYRVQQRQEESSKRWVTPRRHRNFGNVFKTLSRFLLTLLGYSIILHIAAQVGVRRTGPWSIRNSYHVCISGCNASFAYV